MSAIGALLIVIVVALMAWFVYNGIKNSKSKNAYNSDVDFNRRMDEAQNSRNLLVAQAKPQDDDYGYSETNPIMESSVHTSYAFLDRLRTTDGKAITYDRCGSLSVELGGQVAMVDTYKLLVDGEEFKILYICPYGHALGKAPKGLTLAP